MRYLNTRLPRAGGALVAILGLWACSASEPATVFVPAQDYRQSLSISTGLDSASTVRVGRWLLLHARRSTGPWRSVPRTQANLTDCWWRRPPPPEEAEAASNVAWQILPADGIEFNRPTPPEWDRRLRFSRPGRYRVWAISHGCHSPIVSDTISINVRP